MEKLIETFCSVIKVPSPSEQEENVAAKIIEILNKEGISAQKDSFGNVLAKVRATNPDKSPILISTHMDVVGDDSEVNVVFSEDGKFVETDKKRTLGADDKAGVAAAIVLAAEISNDKNLDHGGLELVFTRDEEHGMTGIKNVDFKGLSSEYVLVLDCDKLGEIDISGASYTRLDLVVKTTTGGHSGLDIADKKRLNAVKLIAELMAKIPQGVYKKNKLGVVTSINAGAVVGGGVQSSIKKLISSPVDSEDYADYVCKNCMSNIINTKAQAHYSIRSSDSGAEKKLIAEIEKIIEKFNKKYKNLAQAEIEVSEHLKAFEYSGDKRLIEVAQKAAEEQSIPLSVSSFHAGAETHIYAHEKNSSNKVFKPVLLGIADIYNMHSVDEKIDLESFKKGYKFLRSVFKFYNQ